MNFLFFDEGKNKMEEVYCLIFLANHGESAVKDMVPFLNEYEFEVKKNDVNRILYNMEKMGRVKKIADEGGKNPRWTTTWEKEELRHALENASALLLKE